MYVAKEGLDYVTRNQYVLTIGVGDDPDFYPTLPQKNIDSTTVTINILDVNDFPIFCTDLATQADEGCTKEVTGFTMYVCKQRIRRPDDMKHVCR